MFIQTQLTPNPNTIKFLPGVVVMQSGTKNFTRDDESYIHQSKLATSIFRISDTIGVFLGRDFIAVTKNPDSNWDYLKPQVLAAIMDYIMSGLPFVEEELGEYNRNNQSDIEKQIIEVIEQKVRPAVAQDGGDIIFDRFEDGVVYVTLQGACSGCPSSQYTLKNGVENMLQHYVPEVKSVEAV